MKYRVAGKVKYRAREKKLNMQSPGGINGMAEQTRCQYDAQTLRFHLIIIKLNFLSFHFRKMKYEVKHRISQNNAKTGQIQTHRSIQARPPTKNAKPKYIRLYGLPPPSK